MQKYFYVSKVEMSSDMKQIDAAGSNDIYHLLE